MNPRIGIVLGSANDVERIQKGLDRLEQLGIPFEFCIASAHRTPERLELWLEGAERRGVRVIIAGAGAAAHLPGVVASKTLLPVIGIPLDATPLQGVDALYSIVQMPPGIPVATVGINSAENAAVLALHILALGDPEIRAKLEKFRESWHDKIARQNEDLYQRFPNARPGGASAVPAPAPAASTQERQPTPEAPQESGNAAEPSPDCDAEGEAPAAATRKSNIRFINHEDPAVGIIEEAVDVLIDGGIVAVPTDTVYGLVADATNPRAVERLYELKGRERGKPLPVLIDTMRMFEALSRPVPPEVLELLHRHWPGPLTLVVPKRPAVLKSVTPDDTIGLRMPDHYVALSLISMAARPLASSSANPSGEATATTAEEIHRMFGSDVGLILDTGRAGSGACSTVLSVVGETCRILREGETGAETLRLALGDLLE